MSLPGFHFGDRFLTHTHLFLLSAPPKPSPKFGFKSPNKNTQVPRPKRTSLKTGEGAGRTTELPFPFGMYRTVQAVELQGWLQHWSQDSHRDKTGCRKETVVEQGRNPIHNGPEKSMAAIPWWEHLFGRIVLGSFRGSAMDERVNVLDRELVSLRPLPALHGCCWETFYILLLWFSGLSPTT